MRRFRFVVPFILGLGALGAAGGASAFELAVGVTVTIAPPPIPVYVQPVIPAVGYLWNPGFWGYGAEGYYWIPGVWVRPPAVGLLWTPGYWGLVGGIYGFHGGYWGPHVGFYGGINYGFGYGGVGFGGGRWVGGAFAYNAAVTHINVNIVHNTYNEKVVVNDNHASFNGEGGVTAKPTADEEAADKEQHTGATDEQKSHEDSAANNKDNLAKNNGGKPKVAAVSKVGGSKGAGKGTETPKGAKSHDEAGKKGSGDASHGKPKPEGKSKPAAKEKPASHPAQAKPKEQHDKKEK
jgi:hypothetical protein